MGELCRMESRKFLSSLGGGRPARFSRGGSRGSTAAEIFRTGRRNAPPTQMSELTRARALDKSRPPRTTLTERVCAARAVRVLNLIPACNVRTGTACYFLQVTALKVANRFSTQGQFPHRFFHSYLPLCLLSLSGNECQVFSPTSAGPRQEVARTPSGRRSSRLLP